MLALTPPITPTFGALSPHQDGIPAIDLPLSFRDAVKVTQILVMKYLWAVSLYIIQDAERAEGWLIESTKMHDYCLSHYCSNEIG